MTERHHRLRLDANEQSIRTNLLPSVATVTFLAGALPLQHFQEKTKDILSANPWLTGRLVKPWFDSLHLVYASSSVTSLSDYLVVIDDDALEIPHDYNNQYALRNPRISQYIVKKGFLCWNKPHEPLFRVILVRRTDDSHYAFILSISHTIVDGYTYYSIYKMFSSTNAVYSMNAVRVMDFRDRVTKMHHVWIQSLLFILSIAWKCFVHPKISKPVFHITRVSPMKIKEIKTCSSGGGKDAAYVSSNDIIICEFNKSAQSDIVIMPVNFRNRLSNITSLHAGNYQAPVGLPRQIITSPSGSRNVLQKLLDSKHDEKRDSSLGFTIANVFTLNIGLVTNWAGFYEDLALPKSQVILHLPMMIIHQAAMQTAVIFKAKADELVVWTAWRSDTPQTAIEAFDDAIGE